MDGARDLGRPVEALARRLRVPAFAGCTVLLAVLAHVAGGGGAPGCPVLVLLTAVVALLWRTVCERELSQMRLLGGVLGTQVGLHVALLDHAGHLPQGRALLAHLVAAVVLAVALRRHELACRTVRPGLLLALLTYRPGPGAASFRPAPTPAPQPRGAVHALGPQQRRGPPCGSARAA